MTATVRDALAEALRAGVDRLDAQLLLAHHLRRPRSWVIAHDDAPLDPAARSRFADDARRRARGVPLAYLLGTKEFRGLGLRVNPDVLVPRPDTETLVDWALEWLDGALRERAAPRIVDLGTGSGAIALAVAAGCPRAEVVATDASAAALEVARDNARRLRLTVLFEHGHWWQAVGDRRFDLALSNPPYVAAGDPHLGALQHEPASALVSGADGLDAIRELVDGAPRHLSVDGRLLVEHGFDQAEAVARLFTQRGFTHVETRRDLAGRPRCTGGRAPAG